MLFAEEDLVDRHVGIGEYRGLEFLHVNARRVINEVPAASRMAFRYTINAYRGCSHACTYCFARPTHEYLGLGIGEDFERKLVVKVNAVERVRAELRSPRWGGDHIAMGTNTDPYQRAEGRYHLTRGILEALGEARNPFSILTKSTLILRDLDLLVAAADRTDVHCNLSIGTLDEVVWRTTEPGTPHPRLRVEAVRRLNQAGIPTGVLVAPVIPGWSDAPGQLAEVAAACVEAGAVSVTPIALHLRPGVKEHFLDFVRRERPGLHAELQRRYARSAYLPRAAQRSIEERVHAVVDPARRRRRAGDTVGHPAPDPGPGPGSVRDTDAPRPQVVALPLAGPSPDPAPRPVTGSEAAPKGAAPKRTAGFRRPDPR
jgi:DNA repair photolyase